MDGTGSLFASIGWWGLLVLTCTHLFILLWWLSMCRIARRPATWKTLVPVVLLVPSYLVLPLLALAAVAALLAGGDDFSGNFKYYLVAAVFGPRRAAEIYGRRSLAPAEFFRKRFGKLE